MIVFANSLQNETHFYTEVAGFMVFRKYKYNKESYIAVSLTVAFIIFFIFYGKMPSGYILIQKIVLIKLTASFQAKIN